MKVLKFHTLCFIDFIVQVLKLRHCDRCSGSSKPSCISVFCHRGNLLMSLPSFLFLMSWGSLQIMKSVFMDPFCPSRQKVLLSFSKWAEVVSTSWNVFFMYIMCTVVYIVRYLLSSQTFEHEGTKVCQKSSDSTRMHSYWTHNHLWLSRNRCRLFNLFDACRCRSVDVKVCRPPAPWYDFWMRRCSGRETKTKLSACFGRFNQRDVGRDGSWRTKDAGCWCGRPHCDRTCPNQRVYSRSPSINLLFSVLLNQKILGNHT